MRKYKRNIEEGIYSKDDKLVFDYSSNEGMRVSFGTKQIKYKAYKTKIEGSSVLSLYQVNLEDKHILRALKGESSLDVTPTDLNYFAKRSALYAFQHIPEEIDIILYSENSYPLFNKFINELGLKFSCKVLKLSQSIYKTDTSFLSIKSPVPDNYKKDVDILFSSLQKKSTIKLRNDIPLKFRKFFTGFISIRDNIQDNIENKNVLVIDDILTTGSTFSELFDILKLRKANNIYGLTLFKFR